MLKLAYESNLIKKQIKIKATGVIEIKKLGYLILKKKSQEDKLIKSKAKQNRKTKNIRNIKAKLQIKRKSKSKTRMV